ncbi:MAG: type III-A CRISPR-associated protein Csm2 [Armatimonadota bacterium]|nr:type III-A CRISPR-associated protein Csm2 [bacterium]MDW8321826.1 type III-A CRISPR-associated protein Csm2 [Armatimonadota bacterium]
MPNPGQNDVQSVINRIKQLKRMSDLEVKEFALEEGLADKAVRAVGVANLKPTQLRKVFHTLKTMQQRVKTQPKEEAFDSTELLQLMPTLAYAVGRDLIPKEFYQLLREVFHADRLQTNADFLRAFDFVEAILAYHKYRS